MQHAIELIHNGMILRGMEHIPEAGEAKVPAVILFHGFTGTKLEPHRMFLKISRQLESLGIASFRFDFLGSGESDGDFEDMTVSKEVAEANTILDFVRRHPQVNPNRVSLLGLSMGGLVASVLAGDRAEEVEKLVLLAPAGNMYELIKGLADACLALPRLKAFDHGGNLVGREFAEDVRELDVFGRASKFEGQVLIIHGTKDLTVPHQVAHRYQEVSYQGRAQLYFIEDADHTFNKHEWETDLIKQIQEFLST